MGYYGFEGQTRHIFDDANAFWSFNYEGDPKAPHAEWTGGRCADGYTNSRLVLSDPRNTEELAGLAIKKYRSVSGKPPDWVIGSSYAAITFSYEVARQLHANHGFVKKSPTDPKGFVWDELTIPRGATVLPCEELIATTGTVVNVRRAVVEGNKNPVTFLPHVLTIFHYPNISASGSLTIVSLAERTDIKTWAREDCPLCAGGSPRLRPAQQWGEFIKKK